MTLDEIRNLGAFVSPETVKQAIELNGHSFDVYIKRLAFGDVEALFTVEAGSRSARMISAAILFGDNQEPITFEEACRLDVGLAVALIEAFNVVAGLEKKVG